MLVLFISSNIFLDNFTPIIYLISYIYVILFNFYLDFSIFILTIIFILNGGCGVMVACKTVDLEDRVQSPAAARYYLRYIKSNNLFGGR